MRKVQSFGDNRNKGWCVHCGGPNETRDHAPSLIFLDDPLPPDLPAAPSCARCNQCFSNDEAYVAALLECVVAGSANPEDMARPKIASLLRKRRSLVEELTAAQSEQHGRVHFNPNQERLRKVLFKLARCHAAYEINEPRTDEPESVWLRPLMLMTARQRDDFENGNGGILVPWPEVGSRAMNRMLVLGTGVFGGGWLDVQPDRYRYRVSQGGGLRVSIVLREYLACEVVWD
jgi:hypothetical protein